MSHRLRSLLHVTEPSHGHDGSELTVVLAGSYVDNTGSFARGDVSELDDTIFHRPIAGTGDDCIRLLASDGAFKPVGSFARTPMWWLEV